MSIDSSMDKMLQRRQEVEEQLSRSAELSNKQLADFSRELSELRPVCDQIELVRQLEGELEDALTIVAEAADDVEIIAEQASKDENTAKAVEEFVERAIENKDVENFTLADVVTEVQVEVFLENPVAALIDVNITEMDLGSLGADMTSDQRQKSKEVVVPVIIASQIIAQAGALMTRRF